MLTQNQSLDSTSVLNVNILGVVIMPWFRCTIRVHPPLAREDATVKAPIITIKHIVMFTFETDEIRLFSQNFARTHFCIIRTCVVIQSSSRYSGPNRGINEKIVRQMDRRMDEGTGGRWTENARTDEGRKDGPGRDGPIENKDERTDGLTDWLFSLLSGWRKIPSFFYCK